VSYALVGSDLLAEDLRGLAGAHILNMTFADPALNISESVTASRPGDFQGEVHVNALAEVLGIPIHYALDAAAVKRILLL